MIPTRKSCATVALTVLAAACGQPPKLNHFVIPDGYTGPFIVVSDKTFSSDVERDGEAFYHVVPLSAVLCVNTDGILRPSFRLTAAYSNGEPIYSEFSGLPNPPNANAIRIRALGSWGGGTESSYVHWFAIGSEETVDRLEDLFFSVSSENVIENEMPTGLTIHRFDNEDYLQFQPYCSDT